MIFNSNPHNTYAPSYQPRLMIDGSARPSVAKHIASCTLVFVFVTFMVTVTLQFMGMVRRGEQISVASIFDTTTAIAKDYHATATQQARAITTTTSQKVTAVELPKINLPSFPAAKDSSSKVVDTQKASEPAPVEPPVVEKPLDTHVAGLIIDAIEGEAEPAEQIIIAAQSSTKPLATDTPMLLPADNSHISPPTTSPLSTRISYAYGQCTYYVATRRPVPAGWSHARYWMNNAKAAGYFTGNIPVAGAIAWTTEGRYGHVAYVEKVEGDQVLVSEMNYVRWNRMTTRWVSADTFRYIY